MIAAALLKKILEEIKKHQGELDYERWHVAFSWKEENQFKYDTNVALAHVIFIDTIDDVELVKSLENSLKTLNIRTVIETDPKYIYLCKTLA